MSTESLHRRIKLDSNDTPLPLDEESCMRLQDLVALPVHISDLDPTRNSSAPMPAMNSTWRDPHIPCTSHSSFKALFTVRVS